MNRRILRFADLDLAAIAQRRQGLDAPPESLALRFARAVAAQTDEILIVHPDNSGHWQAWGGVSLPREPYAVHVADRRGFRTFPLDFDGEKTGDDAGRGASLLRDAGVRYVRTRSGPGGGQHLLATFTIPIAPAAMARVARALRWKFPSLDYAKLWNPDTGAIRPPLSPHRLGGRSEIIGDVFEALAILEAGNPPDAWPHLARLVGIPLLTPRMERLLRYGDEVGRYRSRSEIVHAIALAHVNAGSTEGHLLDDLLDPVNVAGEKVRSLRGDRAQRRYVHRSWFKACARVQRSPAIRTRPDALAQLARIRAAVETASWPGSTGATSYKVICAHLVIAEKARSINGYHASVRDVADLAEMHITTVSRAHRRLIRSGWLRRITPRYPHSADRWRLCIPMQICNTLTSPMGGVRKSVADVHAGDVWRWRGLGKIAERLWELLADRIGPTKALAARCGVSARTASRHLARMARLGLVQYLGAGRWWRVGDELTLDLAAVALGVAGTGERQHQRHQAERFIFHARREGLLK